MSISLEKKGDYKLIAGKYSNKGVRPIFIIKDDFDFDKGKLDSEGKSCKKIKLEEGEGHFFPSIADYDKNTHAINERIYVSGKSGCGKTGRFMRPYIMKFKERYPTSKIYFFSSKPEDVMVDDLPIIRYKVDKNFVDNVPDIRNFKGEENPNLIVFDDIQDYKTVDGLNGKKKSKAVQEFRDEVMRNGRSLGIATVYCWHVPTDYKNTKDQIFESTASVIFPYTSGENDYARFLKTYVGISNNKKIDILQNAKSQFIYISKSKPRYAITDNYIMMV